MSDLNTSFFERRLKLVIQLYKGEFEDGSNTKVPKTQPRGRQQAQETKASDKKENGPQSFANMIFG